MHNLIVPAPVRSVPATGAAVTANDAVLHPLLRAASDTLRRELVEQILVSTAAPVVETVLRRKSSRLGHDFRFLPQDEEDIRATAIYRIARRILTDLEDHPIARFADYCAAITMHACDDHLRERTPERCSLRRRVLHILRTDHRFACWTFEKRIVCGRVAWAERPPTASPGNLETSVTSDLAGAVDDLFTKAATPLIFTDLVSILAPHFAPRPHVSHDLEAVTLPSSTLQTRELVCSAWREIVLLPYSQRTALLLNLRDEDGRSALVYLPLTGVATIPEIAAVLEMDVHDLARMWNDLPLPDLMIAQQLGATRQRVINLRQAARKRLYRRLGSERA